jgi:hypothetical protein
MGGIEQGHSAVKGPYEMLEGDWITSESPSCLQAIAAESHHVRCDDQGNPARCDHGRQMNKSASKRTRFS